MEKYLRVTMEDGSKWDVAVSVIAKNRAEYYAPIDFDGDVQRSLDEDTLPLFESDNYEIEDWAANNMNWEDVQAFATRARPSTFPDYQEGWINGEKEIINR